VDTRKVWKTACEKAGYPGKLIYDLRRTAARNFTRAGVPENVAMSIAGHKTTSMFQRYNITSQEDQRKALIAVRNNLNFTENQEKVVSLKKTTS
jgi:integrase